VKRIAEVH